MISSYGFTYSLINPSNWDISPVKPEASAVVTLLEHWVKENGSPGTPRLNSFVISAADTALLDALNLSLEKDNKSQQQSWQMKSWKESGYHRLNNIYIFKIKIDQSVHWDVNYKDK